MVIRIHTHGLAFHHLESANQIEAPAGRTGARWVIRGRDRPSNLGRGSMEPRSRRTDGDAIRHR